MLATLGLHPTTIADNPRPFASPTTTLRPASALRLQTAVRGFVPNAGQLSNPAVRFALRDQGVSAYFTDSGFVLWGGQTTTTTTDGIPVRTPVAPRWHLVGARPVPPEGGETFPHTASYFRGNDPARWRPNLPAYRDIRFPGILEGVELRVETRDRGFEYTFHLEAGARPELRFRYEGITALELSPMGDLVVQTAAGSFTESRPVSYQFIEGERRDVESRFEQVGSNEYRIALGPHDEGRPLVVDPVLDWSTFLGGDALDRLYIVRVHSDGDLVVAGDTYSSDLPYSAGFDQGPGIPLDSQGCWHEDAYVAKLSRDGTRLRWAGYLGGNGATGDTLGRNGLAIATDGDLLITGTTDSPDFPIIPTTGPQHAGAADAFVARLEADGSAIVWSTLLGGLDEDLAEGLTLDGDDNVFIGGLTRSGDLPLPGAFDATLGGGEDGLIAAYDASGNLQWASYLGGHLGQDRIADVVHDGHGGLVLLGDAESPDFPVTLGAYDTGLGGVHDAFVARLAANGTGVEWATFLGGSDKEADLDAGPSPPLNNLYRTKSPLGEVVLDNDGNPIVIGVTYSSDFPTTPGAFDVNRNGVSDGFVTKLKADGSGLLWSTYLGGSGPADSLGLEDRPRGIALNAWGEAFVTGWTKSGDFPTTPGAIKPALSNDDPSDAFVTKFDGNGQLLYSTYLGSSQMGDVARGIDCDAGDVCVVGGSFATFPITAGAFQTACGSCPSGELWWGDGFVVRLLEAFVAYDGFESGNYSGGSGWAAAWSASGDVSILTSSQPHSGTRHVRLRRGTGLLSRSFDAPQGATSLALGFWTKIHSFEGSDRAEVRVNGITGAVASFTSSDSDNRYRYVEVDISAALPQGQLQVTFDAMMGDTGDNWYLDDIRITGTQGNVPPSANAGPDQTVVDEDQDGFEWVTLDGTASLDVDGQIVAYEWTLNGNDLGETASQEVAAPVGTTTYTLTVTDNEGAIGQDTVEITVTAPVLGPIEVFSDGFEDGALGPWTQDAQNDWSVTNNPVSDGARAAKVDGSASSATLSSPLIDLQGRTAATITFAWFIGTNLDNGEYLACDVSVNGGSNWSEVARLSGKNGSKAPEGSWQNASIQVASAAGTVRLRFRGTMNSTDEFAAVDDVRVVAE
jgi:hypothetical protein